MDPKDIYKQPPTTRVSNTLSVTQPGEQTLCSMKRHPIGIFGIYAANGFAIVVMAILAFSVAPSLSNGTSSFTLAATLGFVIVSAVCLIFALIATKVYWGNSWVVTSDSITQVAQISLFSRQSSQLSLESLEDVTVEQNGILPHIFNYGTLKAETAGHHSKFVFPYCPNPNYYAQQILAAHEAFAQVEHHMSEPAAPAAPAAATLPLDPTNYS